MIYKNVKFHNVHELLEGGPEDILKSHQSKQFLEGQDGSGKWFLRIPNNLRAKLVDHAQLMALQTPGCEIRFNLKSETGTVVLKSVGCSGIVELYQGCFLVTWCVIGQEPTEIPVQLPTNIDELETLTKKNNLPFDANLTRVILPRIPITRLIGIEGDFELPCPKQTPPVTCLFYGSSITLGSLCVRPTGSYAYRTTQLLGLDMINLGFGGTALLESEMADYIASRTDWDMAVLEMGINLITDIDVEEFAKRVDYFVKTIAGSHPNKWIFCIDLFTCNRDFAGDEKITQFRNVVRDTVGQANMSKLVHVSGADILTSVVGLTADLVHPSPYGMEEMAMNLSTLIRAKRRQNPV